MKNSSNFKRHIGLFITLASVVSVFAGCKKKNNQEETPTPEPTPTKEITDEELIAAIENSNPDVKFIIDDDASYTHIERESSMVLKDVDEDKQNYGSSAILDMPVTGEICVVFNEQADTTLAPSDSLFANLVTANSELQTITVKDRSGTNIERNSNCLSADGSKLKISVADFARTYDATSNAMTYNYGEVYQIAINDADFLCFENRDPSIRTLTVEIQDDPLEDDTIDENVLKSTIKNIDLKKVLNKKVDTTTGKYSFDYAGVLPDINRGDVFYATIDGKPNPKFDFYGIFESQEFVDGNYHVIYDAANIDDVYDEFHHKGQEPVDFSNEAASMDIPMMEEEASKHFKSSTFALGLARTVAPLVSNDLGKITSILSNFKINVNINIKDNTLSMKFCAGIYGYKLKDQMYLTVDFGYEKITTYTIDFDVSISYSWIFPSGVDYKIKCIEDTQEIYYLKATFTKAYASETPKETDLTKTIENEIDAIKSADAEKRNTSVMTAFDKDTALKPATSGSKTTWPIVVVDLYYLAPISMRLRADFYIDAGFQAMLMFSHETQSSKVDFCFSNVGGSDTDVSQTVKKSTNWQVGFVGSLHFEVGFRLSYSFSILGLYDYLKAEAYAEAYVNASLTGMLTAAITVTDLGTDFTGYIGVDAAVVAGMRVGLDFKILIFNENVNKVLWTTYLYRIKYENSIEHVASEAQSSIQMDSQTMSLDQTDVLIYECFNSITMGLENKKIKANDTFSIISGAFVSNSVTKDASGHIFQYSIVEDPSGFAEINEDGEMHIRDGSPVDLDFKIGVHVSNWCGTASDRVINVHYHASDAKEAYLVVGDFIAGTTEPVYYYIGEYRPGAKLTLPEGPKFRGFIFSGYAIYDGVLQTGSNFDSIHPNKIYHPGDEVEMPIEGDRLVFQCFYQTARKFTVNFYDGNNNLVYVDQLYEGEDATEPYAAMRDRFMDKSRYTFVGWNRKFNNVQSNLDVYGIYIGIEEVR